MVKFLRPSLAHGFGGQITISFVEINKNQIPAEVRAKAQTEPLPLVYFEKDFQFAGEVNYGILAKYLKESNIVEKTTG